LGQATMTRAVPIMVAVMVWMVRLLIIGTFSVAGERLFTLDNARTTQRTSYQQQHVPSRANDNVPASSYLRPAPKPAPAQTPAYASNQPRPAIRPEPTYHPVGMNAQGGGENHSLRS